MKEPARLLLVAIVAGLWTTAPGFGQELPIATDNPSVEFAGYVSVGNERRFVLCDVTTRVSSSLLKIGQTWRGRLLQSFDPGTETLTLQQGENQLNLSLRAVQGLAKRYARILGTWQSVAIKGPAAPRIRSARLVLGADGLYSAQVVCDNAQTFEAEGRYLLGETSLELLRGQRASEKGTYSINGGLMVVRFAEEELEFAFARAP